MRVKYFEGNCFCEIALFVPGRARDGALFVADTYAEVQRLHKRDFDRVVEQHLDEDVLSELRGAPCCALLRPALRTRGTAER